MIEGVPPNPSNEVPQNPVPPEQSGPSVWSPDYVPGQQPVAQTAGAAAVGGNVAWDQPERPVVREAGEFPQDEIEQVRGVYTVLRQATMLPEAAKTARSLDPTTAAQHLDIRLQAIERGIGEGSASKRMAMIAGTMVAASPLGNSGEVAGRAVKLIGGGAVPAAEQLEVFTMVRSNMKRALAEGTADEAAQLKRIDELLYGTGSSDGLLPRVGEPPLEGNERAAEFWLAYAAGLDTSADGVRRLRNLTEYMGTGRRGPNYIPLEQQ